MILMDYAITWGGDPEDVCLATSGVASVADLDAMVREAVRDPRWIGGMKVLLDHTQSDWTAMTTAEIEQRAELLKQLTVEIGPQQIAFVAGPENYSVGRLLHLLLDWQVGYVGRVFDSLEDAREWLSRPPHVARAHAAPRPEYA